MWSIDVVEIAFEHPFLLHGIFALAAVHKTLVNPEADRTSLLAQADTHMTSSLSIYREHLEKPTLETAVPMFLLAATLFTYNLASAQIEEPERPLDALLHCFRLIRGIREVVGAYWQQLTQAPIVKDLLSGVTDVDGIPVPDDSAFTQILDLQRLTTDLNSPDREVLLETLENLHKTFLKTRICADEQHVVNMFMTWPARLSDEYLALIEAHNPVAVIVVAHFAVLMSRSPSAWWMKGWPERIIDASLSLLDTRPELREWLDWPVHQIRMSV